MVSCCSVAIASAILAFFALVFPAAEADSRSAATRPVLSFAWISDLHLDESRLELARETFRWIDERLAPDFVLFTGDDNAIPAPPENPAATDHEDLRRHRFFKDFLAEHLRAPAVAIPGDNWPGGFDQVFGAAQRSFDCCGLHFLLLAPDRTHKGPGMEGLSVLDEATWAWIRKDLDASRDKPVIVAIHEPVHPPTFLDAVPLRRLLAGRPQVIAVVQGHLHVDLHLQADGKAYLTAPALGPTRAPALKQVLVFPDRLVVRTFARDPKTSRFARLGRDRHVEVPKALGANLRRPDGGSRLENLSAVPPHPHVDDRALLARRWELLRNLSGLLDRDLRSRAESPPTEPARTPAARGRDFIAGLFDSDLRLLPEYRGAKVYWLSHDNCLAARVLAESHPEIAKAIAEAVVREGLPRTDGKTEVLFGESPRLLPFHEYELTDVRKAGEKILRTEIKTSRPMKSWEEFADLLFFASMAQAKPEEARRLWDKGMSRWDGKGFNDAATKGQGSYATFKLALATIAAARLAEKPEVPKALTDRLLALQEETGGWVTNYTADGKPVGLSNVETTCLAILGCEAMQHPSTKERRQ